MTRSLCRRAPARRRCWRSRAHGSAEGDDGEPGADRARPGVDRRSQDVRESVARIESRREQLEATLSERSAEFRAEMHPVTLEAVQAAIPGDAVLLEFAVFRPFDPEAERNEEAYGRSALRRLRHLEARHADSASISGAVEDIDPLVVRMRESLRDPGDADVKARARAVDERVMRPLRAFLNGATRLLISPDGGLNLVPFEALVDEHGRYLIERYATTYLTSGRDLLRMQFPRAAPGKPVIVADPLFGEPVVAAARRVRAGVDGWSVDRCTVGSDIPSLYFAPLLGERRSRRARSRRSFPEATLLTGRRATKATLERVTAPASSISPRMGSSWRTTQWGGGRNDAESAAAIGTRAGGRQPARRRAWRRHPDRARSGGLNLWGTNLVTLSACDTGVGRRPEWRRRLRASPCVHACGRRDAGHEPVAGE